jgi:hypothetical protein
LPRVGELRRKVGLSMDGNVFGSTHMEGCGVRTCVLASHNEQHEMSGQLVMDTRMFGSIHLISQLGKPS